MIVGFVIFCALTVGVIWWVELSPQAKASLARGRERSADARAAHKAQFSAETRNWGGAKVSLEIARKERLLHTTYHGGGGRSLTPHGAMLTHVEIEVLEQQLTRQASPPQPE